MADLGTDIGEFCPRTAVAERTIHSTPKKEKKRNHNTCSLHTKNRSEWMGVEANALRQI